MNDQNKLKYVLFCYISKITILSFFNISFEDSYILVNFLIENDRGMQYQNSLSYLVFAI